MLYLEQRLCARHERRGVRMRARLLHGVEARGWRMKFSLLRAEVEIDADPRTYEELARKLNAANVHVRPARIFTVAPKSVSSPVTVNKPALNQPAILASSNQMKPLYCQDGGEMKVSSPPCHSPGAILPDLPPDVDDTDKNCGLSKEATATETATWLTQHRFAQHANTFANFSGADLLRLSRDDIIQICGLADGIRLFNALHAKRIEPRLTVYVCAGASGVYSALYLHACSASLLANKLRALLHDQGKDCECVLVSGPHGARVRLSDDVVRHMADHSTYRLDRLNDTNGPVLLLSSTHEQ